MKKKLYHQLVFVVLAAVGNFASFAQTLTTINLSGKFVDQETQETLAGVNVVIKGTVTGTITGIDGTFTIKTRTAFPLTLVVICTPLTFSNAS